MYVFVWMCVWVCVCVSMCMHVCMCVYICLHVWVCVWVHVCMRQGMQVLFRQSLLCIHDCNSCITSWEQQFHNTPPHPLDTHDFCRPKMSLRVYRSLQGLKWPSPVTRQDFQWREQDTKPATKPSTYNLYCLQNVLWDRNCRSGQPVTVPFETHAMRGSPDTAWRARIQRLNWET